MARLNRAELVEELSAKLGDDASKAAVDRMLTAFTETVAASLKKGDSIAISGFGTFEARKRAARKGVNPRTGQSIRIKAATNPHFKAGTALREMVNGKRKLPKTAKKTAKKAATAKKVGKKTAKKSTAKKSAAAKKATKKSTAKKATKKAASKR